MFKKSWVKYQGMLISHDKKTQFSVLGYDIVVSYSLTPLPGKERIGSTKPKKRTGSTQIHPKVNRALSDWNPLRPNFCRIPTAVEASSRGL